MNHFKTPLKIHSRYNRLDYITDMFHKKPSSIHVIPLLAVLSLLQRFSTVFIGKTLPIAE